MRYLHVLRLPGLDRRRDVVRLIDGDGRQVRQLAGGGAHQLARAQRGGRGDLKEPQALALHVRAQFFKVFAPGVVQQVALVRGDELRPGGQLRAVALKLGVYRLEILHGVAPLAAGDVHQVYQQPAAVDVPQKVVPQPGALARALDDAGDVRQHEGHVLVHIHHAQVGEERREMVVGDLRVRVGDHGEQRALAHVGEAHEPHVGQQLQLQQYAVALPGQARLGKAGDLARGGGEVLVAPAAAPAAAGHIVLAGGHVVHYRAAVRVAQKRAARDAQYDALAVLAGAALALAVLAVPGDELALIAEVHQRGHVAVGLKNDVAAAAAVAAVRPAGRHVFLAVEGHRPVPALTGADFYSYLVNKG